MSAYIRMATPMTDRECLVQALADMGFGPDKVVVSELPRHLEGYLGERRPQVADVIIPRKYVGRASNDIGFYRTPHGYQATISKYDRRKYGNSWLAELTQRYQKRWSEKQRRMAEVERRRVEQERKRLVEQQRKAVVERARKMGYTVKETKTGGKLRLVLVKRSY